MSDFSTKRSEHAKTSVCGPIFVFRMVRTIPSKKKEKVARAIPAARADPKSKTILFFLQGHGACLGVTPCSAQPSAA